MKKLIILSLALLGLTLGSAALAHGKHGHHDRHYDNRGYDRHYDRDYDRRDYRYNKRYYGGRYYDRGYRAYGYRPNHRGRDHYHRGRPIVRVFSDFDRYLHCPGHGGYFLSADIYYY